MPKAATAKTVATGGFIPQVDIYIAKAPPFAQPILQHLRGIVHAAAPGVVEEMKWSRPFFVYQGVILGNISAFKQHCSFGLWGKEIAQTLRADGVASSEGMGTFGKITAVSDLPSRTRLVAYVREAARTIASGDRTTAYTRPKVAKAAVETPAVLAEALTRNQAAAKAFAAMSPSARKEYSVWIAEARRDETRDRRLATAIEWIAEGKGRNWKYEQA
jgi:uncharacterized protein YdeI (YjbR/CyaY-like superfamily)